MPRLLVATSVHPPDDPRIRYKLIPTLRTDFTVTYAAPSPGPATVDDVDGVVPLGGARLRRALHASWLVLRGRYDVASLHDPELLPAALLAAALGRRIVFDLHEDLPAHLATRPGMPTFLRRLASPAARALLRLAERRLTVTIAEAAYARHFRGDPPVVPNLLEAGEFPDAVTDPDGVAYLGDVTAARGALTLVQAGTRLDPPQPLHLVGRCPPDLRHRLEGTARAGGVPLEIHGYLPRPEALQLVATCAVGVSPLLDLPNYRHSLPTKVLEYLAVGLPVVASDLPGTRRVIGDLPGVVLVPPGDADALADGITAAQRLHAAARANAPAIKASFRWPDDVVRELYWAALRR